MPSCPGSLPHTAFFLKKTFVFFQFRFAIILGPFNQRGYFLRDEREKKCCSPTVSFPFSEEFSSIWFWGGRGEDDDDATTF